MAAREPRRLRRLLRWARPRHALALLAAAAAIAASLALEGAGGAPEPEPGSELLETLEVEGLSIGRLAGCLNLDLDSFAGGAEDGHGSEQAVLGRLRRQVARVRELEFERPPEVELLSEEELRERLASLLEEGSEPRLVELQGRILKALGAIPADADLLELQRTALAGQVAGVYNPENEELLALTGGELGPEERLTLAHELQHALADQRLGLPLPSGRGPDRQALYERADALGARVALVEGDATLTMLQWAIAELTLAEVGELTADPEALAASQAGLEDLPPYLRSELLHPYLDGIGFVCALYRRGGWDAVDRAYRRPPSSSAEILFPDRYGESIGTPPSPGGLASPWSRRLRVQLGAAPLLWLLEAPGGDEDAAVPRARGLVSAWEGGRLDLWTDGAESAIGISLLERGTGPTLCAGIAAWYVAAFPDAAPAEPRPGERLAMEGPDQGAVIRCPPGRVRVGIAPSLAEARRLAR